MLKVITVDDVKTLIHKVTLEKLLVHIIEKLELCFQSWEMFQKVPRIITHFDHGVIELMPTWKDDYYSVKYINGHPLNMLENKQTVIGLGLLADITTGYPLMISEMTLLTAIRTAATSALAAKYLAKQDASTMAVIGTGAQSEFQVMAHRTLFPLKTIRYFDIDPEAMNKFARNLQPYNLHLERCQNAREAVQGADIICTLTAVKKQAHLLEADWIQPGTMINAIGGDSKGKTELDPRILSKAHIVVEFLKQTQHEGEIQNTDPGCIYAELWEVIKGIKPGYSNTEDAIFLFDSVGFALEDYAMLRLIYQLAETFHVGHMMDMVPELRDPKDLFGSLSDVL